MKIIIHNNRNHFILPINAFNNNRIKNLNKKDIFFPIPKRSNPLIPHLYYNN